MQSEMGFGSTQREQDEAGSAVPRGHCSHRQRVISILNIVVCFQVIIGPGLPLSLDI